MKKGFKCFTHFFFFHKYITAYILFFMGVITISMCLFQLALREISDRKPKKCNNKHIGQFINQELTFMTHWPLPHLE